MIKKLPGFALLEVIVAIVILASVLSGATTLIWSATNAVTGNQDRLTATYLAQECLELARNARDTAWRQHLPWDCAFDKNCTDMPPNIQTQISEMNTTENLVSILETNSKFNRKMEWDESTQEDSITITCTVDWPRRHSGRETISLTEILTNWRKL